MHIHFYKNIIAQCVYFFTQAKEINCIMGIKPMCLLHVRIRLQFVHMLDITWKCKIWDEKPNGVTVSWEKVTSRPLHLAVGSTLTSTLQPGKSHVILTSDFPFLTTIISLHWEKPYSEPDALNFLLSHPPNYNQISYNWQGYTKVKPQVMRRGHL